MNPVLQRGGEQVVPSLHERCKQQHGILNVRDRVGTRIVGGEDATSLFGGQSLIGYG